MWYSVVMFKTTKQKSKKEHIHILLNPGTHVILKILAAHLGCSVSQLVQAAVDKMINETKKFNERRMKKDGKKD